MFFVVFHYFPLHFWVLVRNKLIRRQVGMVRIIFHNVVTTFSCEKSKGCMSGCDDDAWKHCYKVGLSRTYCSSLTSRVKVWHRLSSTIPLLVANQFIKKVCISAYKPATWSRHVQHTWVIDSKPCCNGKAFDLEKVWRAHEFKASYKKPEETTFSLLLLSE